MDAQKKPGSFEDEQPHIVENSTIFSEDDSKDSKNEKPKKRAGGYGKIIAMLSGVCVVIAAAITCTLLFWEVPESEDTSSSASSEAIEIISEKVNTDEIKIKNENGDFTLKKYTETVTETTTSGDTTTAAPTTQKKYKLVGFDKYPMSADEVTDVANALVPMKAESKLSGEWTDDRLGLDKPVLTAVVGDVTLTVGKTSGMGDQRYCRVSGDNNIYLISGDVYDKLNFKPSELVDTNLITALSEHNFSDYFASGTLVAFDSIELSGTNFSSPVKISCKNSKSDVSSFVVTSPKSFYADMSKIETLLTPLSSGFTATNGYELITDSTDLKKYGLDNPQYILTYKLGSSTFKIELSKKGVIDDGVYACRVNNGNVIYSCNTDNISFIIDKIDDLRSTILFSVSIKEVDTFTVEYNGKSATYDIGLEKVKDDDGNEKEQTVVRSMSGEELDTESFQNVYMALASVSPSSYGEDSGKLTQSPYLKITLKMNDKSTQTVKFIKYDDRYYRMYLNDIGDQLINYTAVERLVSYFEKFAAGEKVDSPALYD